MFDNPTKVNVLIFDSLEELVTDIISLPKSKRYNPFDSHGGGWIGRSFLGFEEVRPALHSRWEAGQREYDAMMIQLRDEKIQAPQEIKRTLEWNEEEGDEFNEDRYQHQLPHLRRSKRTRRVAIQQVTIICNTAISSGEDSMMLIWRAAATVCLTTLLEEAGYRVEVWGVNNTNDTFTKLEKKDQGYFAPGVANALVAVRLKEFNSPMDTVGLVNALSGWAFRTIYMGALHLWKEDGICVKSGMGSPHGLDEKRIQELTYDKQVITCERIFRRYEAVNWIKDEIKKLDEGEQ